MPASVTVTGDDVMVDLLLYRRYGRPGQALLEATLELNPGIAELGPVLPIGTVVLLPDAPPAVNPRRVVSLFG